MTPDQPPPDDDDDVGVPPLNTFEEKLLAIGIGGALGVGGIGLYSSYDAVGKAADGWGFDPYWILPVGIDVAIPVFSLAHLLLIRLDMSLAWVRAVPWALTFVSMYLNITAADDNLPAQIGHGALPLLWVGCSEIAAHIYRNMIGAATGRRMERVRRARWILAPLSTARLWRRMVLTEITSYRVGLERERNRKMVRAEFQDQLGKGWRKKITKRQKVQLWYGEMKQPEPRPEVPVHVPVQVPLALEPAAGSGSAPEVAIAAEPEPAPALEMVPVQVHVQPEPEVHLSELEELLKLGPLEPEPAPEPEPEPQPGRHGRTANLGDRASKKNQQVEAVLNLMEERGYRKVNLKMVQEELNLTKTTAHHRLKDARTEWDKRNQQKAS